MWWFNDYISGDVGDVGYVGGDDGGDDERKGSRCGGSMIMLVVVVVILALVMVPVMMKEKGAGRCGGKRVIQVGLMNGSATFYSLPSSSHHDALQGGRSCAKL